MSNVDYVRFTWFLYPGLPLTAKSIFVRNQIAIYMCMFRAIGEFVQSRDCVVHSQNPEIA